MELTIVKDTQELERLEEIVDKCRDGINKLSVEGAQALRKIRDDKLYEKVRGEENFEKYCQERWDITRQRVYQMIDYIEVIENVNHGLQNETVPENERQARPLARLKPDQQLIAWQKVVDTAPEGKVTTALVTKVVNEMTKKPPKTKIKIDLREEVDPEFEKAWKMMYEAIKGLNLSKWKTMKRDLAINRLENFIAIIKNKKMEEYEYDKADQIGRREANPAA